MKLLDDSGLSHLIGRIKSWLNDKADKSQVLTNVPANAIFTDTVYTHPAKHPASVITQDASNRFVSDAEKSTWNAKVESSRVLTDVPANAIFTDTKYTHPATHPSSIISQTASARFVTDTEKGYWNAKVESSRVLTDVPTGAIFTDTVYTHPAKHPASVITQDASNRFVSDAEKSTWNAKVESSRVLTDVPANAIFTDTKYTHPSTHPPSIIAQTSVARFVTDTEKGYWNAKVESSRVLTDVPTGAIFTDTVYTHPAKHPASVITQDASNRFVTDTEKGGWNAKADMSDIPDISGKADITYVDNKVKTDVPANAIFTDTKYTHPATHPSSIISQTASARFVTDTEKGYWNAKVESSRVLTDVPTGAIFTDTVYTHPAKHPASVITQDASNRFVTDTEKGGWNAKADMSDIPDISGKADITYVDNKVKTDVPANAIFTDTKYTHPATHPSSIISQTASARFVTDTEKGYWNAKVESSRVLTDVPTGAIFTDTVYTHPAKHPASVITQDASNRFVTDTEKGGWNAKADMSDIPDISGKADITYVDNKVKTDVPANAVFTDTPTDISGKVDKVAGKGLSTNDYTTAEKTKLGNLPKIWIGEEANKGTATDTLYFCYE